ncbi:hypothetical protein C8R46DRAFT_1286307 [Mycena filopes]|nr:hypothetical protein C8R46DRAFT_1286307 [Mycena filopes]
MSVVLESDPKLPVELEREIFILATSDIHIRDIRSIIMVARRVRLWVTPILYRSFLVCHRSLVDDAIPLRRTPKEFRKMVLSNSATVTAHIRDLWITTWVDPTHLGQILSTFSTIETLGIFGNSLLIPGRLPALACRCAALDFTHPMFARLTHLSLRDRPAPDDWASWGGLFDMPCLTHLSFKDFFAPYVVEDVLAKCRTLRLLVLKTSNARWTHEDLTPDVRCVVVFVKNALEDWEAGIGGGDDYWSKAEIICSQRRTSTVEVPRSNI